MSLTDPRPPQNPSMVQWSHCKYYSVEQRGQKPGDLYSPDGSPQVGPALVICFVWFGFETVSHYIALAVLELIM